MIKTSRGTGSWPVFVWSFLMLLALWLLASGHYTFMLIGCGVLSCAAVVVLGAAMGILDKESVPYHLLLRGLRYLPWWFWEVVKANIDVALRILKPSLPISPRVFEVTPTQKTDLGKVIYAQSITTTPGTVSIEAEGGEITVHAIAEELAQGLLAGEMDRQVTRLEGGNP